MERPCGCIGFFRFRSPAVGQPGDPKTLWFISENIRCIDLNNLVFLEETLAVSQVFPGTFSFKDILELSIDEYEYLMKRVVEVKNDGRPGS